MYYNYQKSMKQFGEPKKLGKYFGKTIPKKSKSQWFAMDSSQISCSGKTFVELWCLYGSLESLSQFKGILKVDQILRIPFTYSTGLS